MTRPFLPRRLLALIAGASALLAAVVHADTLTIGGEVTSLSVAAEGRRWAAVGSALGPVAIADFAPATAAGAAPLPPGTPQVFVFLQDGATREAWGVPLASTPPHPPLFDVRVSGAALHPDGVLAIVGNYVGRLGGATGPLPDADSRDGFLILVDVATRATRSVLFHTAHVDELSAIAATADGFVVVGYGGGDGHLGDAALPGLSASPVAGLVASVGRDGRVRWVQRIEAALIDAVSTDASGGIVVSGWLGAASRIGVQPIEVRGQTSTFAVGLAANGTPRWATSLGGRSDCAEFITRTLALADGGALTTGTYCGEDAYPAEDLPASRLGSYLARIEADGRVR